MTTTAINLPLLRVLKSLNVSDAEAEAAAEATPPNLSQLATRDDLKAYATKDDLRAELKAYATEEKLRGEIAPFRADMRAEFAALRTEIAQSAQRQTAWMVTVVLAAAGVIIATVRLLPPVPQAEAPRTTAEQSLRGQQVQPGGAQQPRPTPQP